MDAHWFRTEDTLLTFTPDRTRFFEVSAASANSTPDFDQGFLKVDELEDWLKGSHARASDAYSTLRVLFGECRQATNLNVTSSRYVIVPFSRPRFTKVTEAFHIPGEFIWALEEPSAQVAKFRHIGKYSTDSTWCK